MVLKNLDINTNEIRVETGKLVRRGPDAVTRRKLPRTPRARKVIRHAAEEAQNPGHKYIDTEDLLLGLLREEGGVAALVPMNLGVKSDAAREEVIRLEGGGVTRRK